MKDDNSKRLRHNRVWLTEEACDLDAFRRSVERSADLADYPFASRRHIERARLRRPRSTLRRCVARDPQGNHGGMGRGADRRTGHRRHSQRVRRHERDRRGQRSLLGDHRGRAPQPRRRRRSFRQARRQRPHLECARKAVSARPGRLRRLLRQRGDRARKRSLARPVLSDHLAAQRRQSGRRGSNSASRLPSRLSIGPSDRALSRARPPAVARAHPARRGRPLRHAARDRVPRSTCRSRKATCPATSRRRGRSFATISTSITSSCRSPRATRCFSTRPFSTPPERTARRTCAASPTSCRSLRLSAARWRASTGSR